MLHASYIRRYFNVSLILDGDQMSTNSPDGFNNDTSPIITWSKPTDKVSTVVLIFRDNEVAADLKIFYHPEL